MKKLALAALAICLTGCVSTGDMPLAKNVYQVNVEARGALFVGGAQNAALKRAAELTIKNGYTSFIIQNPSVQTGSSYVGTTPGYANTTINAFGNTAYANTTYTPGVPMFAPEKNVSLIVVMFKPGDPGAANAIDAAATLKRLSAQ
jgi:hypothetical protein